MVDVLVSVFTPSHKNDYLEEVYLSLLVQTYRSWEWILVLNGPLALPPANSEGDLRVRVIRAPEYMSRMGVGALKRFACENASGDWLFELDHDDVLDPTAIEKVLSVARASPDVGFVYSDFCNFNPDGSSCEYGAAYGWENYPVNFRGADIKAMRAFAPDPSSLAAIFYAPNHLRAWSKEAYWKAGGHDPLLPVCDDYDLICRTWLAGVGFSHLDECLYFYRMQPGGENTYIQRNQEIQDRQKQISDRYKHQMLEEWCRRQGLLKIDLGGGHGCPSGYVGVDISGAEVCCDIRMGLPFADNSVGCVRAFDFLEHISHCGSGCLHGADGKPRCVVGVMNEIYRVLAPGGWLVSRTPSTDGRGAFQDPTHVSFWNPNSFWYYTRREQANYVRGIDCRFQSVSLWQGYPTPWHEENKILYVFADLVALKGQRQPGIVEI